MILDEADEMLSMGFKEDLESIIHSTSKDKQILLFSATMTKKAPKKWVIFSHEKSLKIDKKPLFGQKSI